MSTNTFSMVLRIFAIRLGATAADVAVAVLLDGEADGKFTLTTGVGVVFAEENDVETVRLYGKIGDVLMAAATIEASGLMDRPRPRRRVAA